MEPTVDVSQLPVGAQRLLDPASPPPLRQMAARGIAPGLKPGDALTVLALLSESTDAALADIANATLRKLPPQLISGALTGPMQPGVLDVIGPLYATDMPTMERVLIHPSITPATVARIARAASEPVSELIATNEQRLLEFPAIIEQLYLNKHTRMSTADRILELAVRNRIELTGIPAFKEAALAIANELIAEPTDDPTPDDLDFIAALTTAEQTVIGPDGDTHVLIPETGEEVPIEDVRPLYTRWASMTGSQKVRMLIVGGGAERGTLTMLGVRDPNPIVSVAAIKSPGITENEITRISAMRNVTEEVLRIIANNREWTRSHLVKFNLVSNPRTPLAFAAKWIMHLREAEIKALVRSKDVSGAVRTAAHQHLQRKGKGG
jgi:hypothetical protein